MRFDFAAMDRFEEATGLSAWSSEVWSRPSPRIVGHIIWASLLHEDPDLTYNEVCSFEGMDISNFSYLIDLGIVDDNQFWKLTPKEFRAHIDRLDEVERRKDLRAGIIASAVMNSQGGKEGGVPYTPSDFFATLPQSTDDDGIDIAGWAAFGEFFEKTAKR
jgi:hypothetical protein